MKCPACGQDNLPGADECQACQGSLMQEDVPQADSSASRSVLGEPLSRLHAPAPECVTLGTSVAAAVDRMRARTVGYVLVTDSSGRLAGIFTERDVLCKVAGQVHDLSQVTVDSLMTADPSTLTPSEPIQNALFLMAHNGFRHVPLVDEDRRPIAIATMRHILEYMEQFA